MHVRTPSYHHRLALSTRRHFESAEILTLLGRLDGGYAYCRRCLVSYDLNYRARLWSQEKAQEVQTPFMKYVDILFTTEADTERVFGIEREDHKQVAVDLAGEFGFEVVTVTLRGNPSIWRNTWTAIAQWRASTGYPLMPEARAREIDRFLRAVEWC